MVFPVTGSSGLDLAPSLTGDESSLSARDRLLQKINAESDLPALGASVSRVVQMASSDDEAVRNLANFILSDVALTQKILRVANTVYYRTASSRPVTTVSKAIFLLGFETVKTSALAMILVERMAGKQGQNVRNELAQALCSSIVGREMARRSQFKDAEEAAIASLFKNIGRLLLAAYDHESYEEMARLVECGTHTPAQASTAVLGCSLDLLTESVLRTWEMPETIVHALAPLPRGVLKSPKGRQEWLQQVATFSSTVAHLIPNMSEQGQEAARKAVLTRFGAALSLDHNKLGQLFASVGTEAQVLAVNAGVSLQWDDHATADNASSAPNLPGADAVHAAVEAEQGLPAELLLDSIDEAASQQIVERHASGKPLNARDLLLAGVQDVAQMMASGRCKVNDLMLLVLETLYGGMGFRFATVCLKDVGSGQFRARISIGEDNAARQAGFVFPIASSRDLFHLAMENDADLLISDATDTKIRKLLPEWHRKLLPDARSFVVLPLVVQKRQLGLFYADRMHAASEGVPSDETALIKTLKGQVLTSLISR